MKGGSSTIEKLTNLSNKYIKSVFHYYNEREEWDGMSRMNGCGYFR